MARPGRLRPLRVSAEFSRFALDQLAGIAALRSRAMFGGIGLYSGELFFGLLAGDDVFLRVDDSTRGKYEKAGSTAFKPYADRPLTMAYWSVPLAVLEDAGELVAWARDAVRAAQRAPRKPRRPTRRKGKANSRGEK